MLSNKIIKLFKIIINFIDIIAILHYSIYKEIVVDDDLNHMQKYIDICLNQTLINSNKTFYKHSHPKISIIISVFNGEPYLKTALRSIQNQDFNNIEIIFVDDFSKDNSANIIKELMKEDFNLK
jgi:cellulose synthase/poly-beta-1,6-N-acetylglucosamine synthase-like glycosyltransferase